MNILSHCDDRLGLLTSTNFGLIPRILAGEATGIDQLGPGAGKVFEFTGPVVRQPSTDERARSSTADSQVTVCAINRNRGGPGQVRLASPPTVAASAIAGHLVPFEELQAQAG